MWLRKITVWRHNRRQWRGHGDSQDFEGLFHDVTTKDNGDDNDDDTDALKTWNKPGNDDFDDNENDDNDRRDVLKQVERRWQR